MPETLKVKTKKIRKPLVASRSYIASVKVNKLYTNVRFPAAVAKYLNVGDNKKIHFTATSGIIQISAQKPQAVIPIMIDGIEGFKKH